MKANRDDLMQEALARPVSHKLRHLTADLRLLNQELKSNHSLDGVNGSTALREFRYALDDVRLTVWTINELLDARQSDKNQQAILSFLKVQRLRRFRQMVQDLCEDFDRDGVSWSVEDVKHLRQSLARVCEGLRTRSQ